jgi:medium-chain acyl-[acyl-carrier-protein] hydrolase
MAHREDQFTVRAFDCQPDGHIKPNALMQYLQEAAARHAEQLGVGFDALDQRGGFWVLTNLRIEMAVVPRWGDVMTIRTWPSGCTRVAAAREFVGTGIEGRELFRAASEWMILDKHTGRLKNLARLELDLPPSGPKALPGELQRLQPAPAYTRACSLRVPFSSLDFNGHVNTTEYVRWALDGLYQTTRRMPPVGVLQATYLAEAFEGDEIEVWTSGDGAGTMRILEQKPGAPAAVKVFLMEVSF